MAMPNSYTYEQIPFTEAWKHIGHGSFDNLYMETKGGNKEPVIHQTVPFNKVQYQRYFIRKQL